MAVQRWESGKVDGDRERIEEEMGCPECFFSHGSE
jgi:hypothetical protein